jgi:putative cell wall-binding protein
MRVKSRWLGAAVATGIVGAMSVFGLSITPASPVVATSTVTLGAPGVPASINDSTLNQAASQWVIAIPNTFETGDQISVQIAPAGGQSCSAGDWLSFDGTPTVTVSSSETEATGQTPPSLQVATSLSSALSTGQPACATDNVLDTLTLSFVTSNATPPATPGWNISISNINYSTGPQGAAGPIMATGATVDGASAALNGPLAFPSNATIARLTVSANQPAVAVVEPLPGHAAVDQPISNIVLSESAAGTVPVGEVCVTINTAGDAFDTTTPPVITASGTGATVSSTVAHPSSGTLAFAVTAASTSPATFTLSGLNVDASTYGPATVTITTAQNATCSAATPTTLTSNLEAFDVTATTRTAGADPDSTAAAEMEAQFNYAATNGCPGGASTTRNVVLATDENYPDALAASYLAQGLHTSILLTPTNELSSATATALRLEGITNVYVVGGPLAIYQNVISTLQSTPAYQCGGVTPLVNSVGPVDLTVTQTPGSTYGTTEYDTAADLAEYFGPNLVGTLAVPGAYGMYNDTTGNASASASTGTLAVPTAILATGDGYQDAESASVLAYADRLPVLLTDPMTLSPQTAGAFIALNIKQVIVMGGPFAVSNAVVSQIEASGIMVLRIAGQDATDTSQELAQFELSSATNNLGAEGLGWDTKLSPGQFVLARGDYFTDGLAGSGFAATLAGAPQPILLTENPSTLGQYLSAFLTAGGSAKGAAGDSSSMIDLINVVGGIQAILPSTLAAALDDLASG